jgi:hypothetical protein
LIEQIFNPWERIFVLNGDLIQGSVINAHPLSSTFLLHKQHRCSTRG